VLNRDVDIAGVVVGAKLIRRSGTPRGTVGIRGKLGRLRLHGRRMSGRVGGTRVRLPAALAARRREPAGAAQAAPSLRNARGTTNRIPERSSSIEQVLLSISPRRLAWGTSDI
jgi:hypothetical protein